jgi:hypothetical protein
MSRGLQTTVQAVTTGTMPKLRFTLARKVKSRSSAAVSGCRIRRASSCIAVGAGRRAGVGATAELLADQFPQSRPGTRRQFLIRLQSEGPFQGAGRLMENRFPILTVARAHAHTVAASFAESGETYQGVPHRDTGRGRPCLEVRSGLNRGSTKRLQCAIFVQIMEREFARRKEAALQRTVGKEAQEKPGSDDGNHRIGAEIAALEQLRAGVSLTWPSPEPNANATEAVEPNA